MKTSITRSIRVICLVVVGLIADGATAAMVQQASGSTLKLLPPATDPKVADAASQETKLSAAQQARFEALELHAQYQRVRELADKGSASQMQRLQAEFDYKVSALNVIALENPEQKQTVEIARANLELSLAEKNLEIVRRLYQKGAIAELRMQQAIMDHELAKLLVLAANDQEGEKLYQIRAAQSRFQMAREVMKKADRLFQTRAISESDHRQAAENLRAATEDLALAKRSLGVTVRQVETR